MQVNLVENLFSVLPEFSRHGFHNTLILNTRESGTFKVGGLSSFNLGGSFNHVLFIQVLYQFLTPSPVNDFDNWVLVRWGQCSNFATVWIVIMPKLFICNYLIYPHPTFQELRLKGTKLYILPQPLYCVTTICWWFPFLQYSWKLLHLWGVGSYFLPTQVIRFLFSSRDVLFKFRFKSLKWRLNRVTS